MACDRSRSWAQFLSFLITYTQLGWFPLLYARHKENKMRLRAFDHDLSVEAYCFQQTTRRKLFHLHYSHCLYLGKVPLVQITLPHAAHCKLNCNYLRCIFRVAASWLWESLRAIVWSATFSLPCMSRDLLPATFYFLLYAVIVDLIFLPH